MSPALLYTVGKFIIDTPWYFMACVPFWKDRRIKKSAIFTTMLLAAIFQGITVYLGKTYAGDNWAVAYQIIYLVYSAVLIGFYYLCFRVSFVKILYAQLLLQALATAINIIAKIILDFALPNTVISLETTPWYSAFIALLIAVSFPFIYRFFNNVLREAFYELSDKNTWLLCIAPVFFYIIHSFLVSALQGVSDISNTMRTLIQLLIIATGLVTYYVNVKMYLEAVQHARVQKSLAEQNEMLDNMNVMKNEFFANTSHEMKTPLTVISAAVQYADALLEAEGGNAEVQEAMKSAQSEVMRVARLVTSTLNLSNMRESRQRMRQLDLGELASHCAEAHRLLIEKKGNILEITAPLRLGMVFGNADMLAQAITNLLENANRHTESGRISLTVSREPAGISLIVADTGSGVAPELLPRIFDRGVSGTGSTGYGLYLCKNIAGAHRGEISMESAPGAGSSVLMLLPIYEGQRESDEL